MNHPMGCMISIIVAGTRVNSSSISGAQPMIPKCNARSISPGSAMPVHHIPKYAAPRMKHESKASRSGWSGESTVLYTMSGATLGGAYCSVTALAERTSSSV